MDHTRTAPGLVARTVRRHALIVKLVIIAVLLLVLLIPLARLGSLVEERQQRRSDAVAEIVGQWGGEQTVAGPFLVVPYIARSEDAAGRTVESVERAYFLPDTLVVDGGLEPQVRNRGIYDATLYTTTLSVSGSFRAVDWSGWRVAPTDILWDQAQMALELPDMRALRERASLRWGTAVSEFRPGKGSMGIFTGEIDAPVPGLASAAATRAPAGLRIPFSFELGLQGGGSLAFLPLGDETTVRLSSPWKSPEFGGAFLPATRALSDKGFEAEWKVLSMARAFPQRWRNGDIDPTTMRGSAFTVNLMTPVDTYLKVTRALKYGFLFLMLPFAALFLFEVFSARRIHPLQYLFVGFADCLFYLLLLSLGEHMSFTLAYTAASVATCSLVTVYTCAIARDWRRGIFILPLLAAAYGFLATVLHSEDYALLIGSIGLFLVLALVMMITRKVNWYGVGRSDSAPHSDAAQ